MTGTAARMQLSKAGRRTDEQLIQHCLAGDSAAWSALIEKYKNLIYSIPIKLGMHQDAGDIFQAVCVHLLSNLSQLREQRALPKWLIQTCYHECLRHRRANLRHAEFDVGMEHPHDPNPLADETIIELEQEQNLREAIAEMPSRCGQMIRMLFFEMPARPYDSIARELGVATGSIGFIRGRCLARLRKYLETRRSG